MSEMKRKDHKTIWAECLKMIQDCLGKEHTQEFESWFGPIVPLSLNNNVLTIQVPSAFFYEYLETHYLNLLRRIIKDQLGPSGKLNYSVVMDQSVAGKPITTQYPSQGQQSIYNKPKEFPVNVNTDANDQLPNPFVIPGLRKIKINSQLNENYTLSNFVEGSCNQLARAAGAAVADNPGSTAFNPLLLYGGVGLGKTHLAHAIGIQTKENHPDKQVLYVTSEQFMQQYGESVKNKTTNDFIHFYEMIDVLIVDDIQFWSGKAEKTQETFFHIFNHLHQRHKQIIITSDKAPSELQGLETRLVSRLKWGLAAELQVPDVETRMNILRQKLVNTGVVMPHDVIEYIAYNINTNVRELEGALVSLIAQSTLNKREITIDLARQMIDKFVKSTGREITIDVIQKTVCDYFGLSVDCIQSKTRKREIVQARQLTMYFAKKMTKSSLAIIGSQCGNKDHATVLHACKTIAQLERTDKQYKGWIDDIEKKLKN